VFIVVDRKRAKEAMQQSSTYNRSLLEASLDPLVTIGRDGTLMDVNRATEAVTGFTREELMGTDFADYFTDPASARAGYMTAYEIGEVRDYPLEIQHADGHLTPVLYNASVYRDAAGAVAGVFAAARDVTAQKQSEEAMRQANAYNRSLLEASLDPLVTIGRDGTITDVNRATEAVTGFTRDDLVGTDFAEYFTDPESARAGYLQAYEAGEVRDYPLEIQHADGHLTPVLYNASVYRDAAGAVAGVFAAARDVTAQKRAEEAMRQANAYNRSLLEASLDPLVTIGRDGTLTDVNRAAEDVTGFKREELVGTDFADYFTDPASARAGYESAYEAGAVRDYPLEIQHADGHQTPVLYNASVYRDAAGAVAGVFAAARDVTEQKRAEEATRQASAYNRSLLEASLDPLVTIGRDGTLTDVNRAAETVTGYSREELVGTDFADYFTDPASARAGYEAAYESGEVRDYPLEIQHADGHLTPVLYNASVYRDAAGAVAGVFAAARDITTQRSAESQLKDTIQELARSNQELEQFAYVASHDLQEPLRVISNYVQLIARRYAGQIDTDADDFINYIVEGATQMKTLINDLLAYSRVSTRGKPFEEVNVGDIMRMVLKALDVAIQESGAVIEYSELPTVFADPTQLTQLFQNLIANAVKFRSERTPEIKVTVKQEDEAWVFSVQDNGIGIESEYFDQLFKIFQRLHTKSEYPGTGIGLAICKRIVERHGGRIWVESEFGVSTTFSFTIPKQNGGTKT
jgi:PAS domain S-box-containing protein